MRWWTWALIVGMLAACRASEPPEAPAVALIPASLEVPAPVPQSQPLTFLPPELALPTPESYSLRAHRVVEEFADEPEEVLWLSPEQMALPADLTVRALWELAPEVATLLEGAGGSVTAAVVVPSRRTIYVANPELAVPLASVVKLVIMLAVLDAAEVEGRTVTAEEIALLDPMVTWSDNDSASWLWGQLGGGPAIDAYLQRVGMSGIVPDRLAWGDSRASGAAVALLLSRLAFADLLSPEHRALALNLLSHVSEDQRRGIGGSLRTEDGLLLGVKDGWYQVARGWRVGSAGVVLPPADAPPDAAAYSIAVLTAENETLEGATETIQSIAALVHATLHPRFVALAP